MKKFRTYREGLIIRGTMYGEPADTKKPAVILSHGFMANSSMCREYAKTIAGLGYLAFIFDFCGGGLAGRSEGRTDRMSVLTEKKDLLAVIRYVSFLPYVDAGRISLLGCSQGGFVSALAAAELKEKIASLILLYPAFCIPDDARKGQMMFARFDPDIIPERIRCGPMLLGSLYVRDVIAMDPYQEIRGYEGPVLYLQGDEDRIVNVSYARRAVQEYPGCIYHEIKGAGHVFHGRDDILAKQYIREFLAGKSSQ